MNKALTILAAMAMCAALGCEKKRETSPEPPRYDAEIDGPPCIHAPQADSRILADQTKFKAPRPSAAAAPPPAAAADPVDAVKKRISDVAAAVKAGQEDRIADLMGEEEAKLMKAIQADAAALAPKMPAFAKAVQDKFGMDLSDKMKGILSGQEPGEEPGPPAAAMPKAEDMFDDLLEVDKLTLKQSGRDVVVTDAKGQTHTFVNTPTGWRRQSDPLEEALFLAMAGMVRGQIKLFDTLMTGLSDDSITQENLEQKMEAAAKQHLQPAMEKFAEAFGEMMKKAFEGLGSTTGPAPAPPGPPTTPGPAAPPPRPVPVP